MQESSGSCPQAHPLKKISNNRKGKKENLSAFPPSSPNCLLSLFGSGGPLVWGWGLYSWHHLSYCSALSSL